MSIILPSNIRLLKHILDETTFILDTTNEKTDEQIVRDPILSRAVLRSLQVIAEASDKVDAQFRARYPNVEWQKMATISHRSIYDYFGVNYDVTLDIIKNELPNLQFAIGQILQIANS